MIMNTKSHQAKPRLLLILSLLFWPLASAYAALSQQPLFLTSSVPPLVMLTMDRSHKLYYEAYNDAGDLNNDGIIDVGYKPSIDYFGYFDSHRCYDYNTSTGVFEPKDATLNKKCSSVAGDWSGDFLNYLTTARIDALRKVLYGGFRSVDTTTSTILKRTFIPQDAHAWGKEYNPSSNPGYLIQDYTPLSQPATGRNHLFANVSLSYGGQPLLRVLNDSPYRIWEWVSIERPVAGTKCLNGGSGPDCAISGGGTWSVVPSTVLSELQRKTYRTASSVPPHPNDKDQFKTFIENYDDDLRGTDSMSKLESNGNPYRTDRYLTIVKGKITVPTSGNYKFSVDGDDAVEVVIDGTVVAGWYGGHGICDCNTHTGTKNLTAGNHNIEFHHEEGDGDDSFVLRWEQNVITSSITDYNVNVQVCVAGKLEANCKAYTDASNNITYKPKGLLQDYGENDSMAFGLITGSYAKNISGGVLRKNIESFKNEVNLNTGIFTGVNGIVSTINKLQIKTFDYSCTFCYASGWITTRPINEGEAAEWGNPIAEMMYEGLRYYAGKAAPTSDFAISATGNTDATLGLPMPAWLDPYTAKPSGGGYPSCSKPMQMVISDINPSFDTDQLPGSAFNTYSGDLAGLNVSTLADEIWSNESEASKIFIGQSGTNKDGAPTAKTANSFKNIRGLAPEEPTKMGGFYASSVALHGARTDLNIAGSTGSTSYQIDQKTDTLSIALASPLPRIEIPITTSGITKNITIVPFAKSVGGSGISASSSDFQPTNQIVDFYVETIVNTGAGNQDSTVNGGRPYGKFRINYEDVEQAADHDMDAIVEYTFNVNSSNQLVVDLNSSYAAGGIIQHMGYVISGTTADGVYLDVRDADTAVGDDPNYFLDTPPGQAPGGIWNDGTALPLTASRTFNVGSTTSASFIKHDPLWYAAKWGVADKNSNGLLDKKEWDSDNNNVPDNYFLVTNAGNLSEQLGKAFFKLLDSASSASAVAANTTRLDTGTLIYQAKFDPRDWSGQLLALTVDELTGEVNTTTPNWEAASILPDSSSRKIFTYNPDAAAGSRLLEFKWDTPTVATIPTLTTSQQGYLNQLNGTPDSLGPSRLSWLRGNSSQEERFTSGLFRNRIKLFNETFITNSTDLENVSIKTNKLGDIVNSDPIYVGTEDFGYASASNGLTSEERTAYTSFRNGTAYKNRLPTVYVGANDGMLHAFDARKNVGSITTGGTELFAYIPNALFPELSKLTSPSYNHQYFVDGLTAFGDVFYGSLWHTIVAGTTGAGGKAVYALDVTDPNAIGPTSALWEFTGNTPTDGVDLGFTLAEPSIGRMQNGKWAVIVGNGYGSINESAVLFILDAETGAVIRKIDTGAIGGNGLSSPVAADNDGDQVIDAIYAGDLKGNMWKFDVSNASPVAWEVANGKPLFVACKTTGTTCANADRQPITAKPGVGKIGASQGSGQMIYFGTGKYFETTDNVVGADPQVQTFYGLWDDNTNTIDDRSMLQEQTIDFEGAPTTASGEVKAGLVRVTSRKTVCYTATTIALIDDDKPDIICDSSNLKKGWAMNLLKPVNLAEGERVISPPVFFNGLVIFSTVIPSSDPCKGGGDSRIMLLEALTGKRPSTSPFDIFGGTSASQTTTSDGKVDSADLIRVDGKDVVASGVGLGIGVHKEISVVGNHGYASGSSGDVGHVTLESSGGGGGSGKRVSWRQLR
jgi:type IV pilus assembly protein PilY1